MLADRVLAVIDEVERRGLAAIDSGPCGHRSTSGRWSSRCTRSSGWARMIIAWDEDVDRLVVEARSMTFDAGAGESAVREGEELDDEDIPDDAPIGPDVLRVRLTPFMAQQFARRANSVVAGGRPVCPYLRRCPRTDRPLLSPRLRRPGPLAVIQCRASTQVKEWSMRQTFKAHRGLPHRRARGDRPGCAGERSQRARSRCRRCWVATRARCWSPMRPVAGGSSSSSSRPARSSAPPTRTAPGRSWARSWTCSSKVNDPRQSGSNERGLLGLAFHPEYQANGRFYVNYTRAGSGGKNGDTVVAEYRRQSAGKADPSSAAHPDGGEPAGRQPQRRPHGLRARRAAVHRRSVTAAEPATPTATARS